MTLVDETAAVEWHTLGVDEVAERLSTAVDAGLGAAESADRLARFGPNALVPVPPPSLWQVAKAQLANPMNVMLMIVAVASFSIGQVATGLVVAGLVTFNVVMGTSQER